MASDKNNSSEQVEDSKKNSKRQQDKTRGQFKVVFKGRLRDGFSKEQVVANIVRLTKIPEDKVHKKFFSGKAVIIRRAHDEPHAQKLQQLFFNAGLEVVILQDQVNQTVTEESGGVRQKELKQGLKKELKKTIASRKRPIVAVVLWLVLIVIAVNLWNEFEVSVEVPEQIISIEQSLANESLVLLAHVNMERLLSLHDYFVDDANALPGANSNFYNNLKKAGIDPQKSIRQMLLAAYADEKNLVTHSILLGEFEPASVKRFLQKHYHGKVIVEPDFLRMQISELDPVSCAKTNFREVAITEERILISTEGHLDELRRLLAKAPGTVTDLSHWQAYRSDKLMSMALFRPEQGTRLATGLPAMMAKGAVKNNQALNSLFAGVGMQLLPPSGYLNVRLNSTDQTWLDNTQTALNQGIAEIKSKSQGLANLLVMLNKVTVQPDDDQLSVQLQMDRELKQAMVQSIQEWSDKFFALDVANDQNARTKVSTEKIIEQPLQFKADYDKSRLTAFNEQLDQFFKPAWIDGPFAVAIEELLLEDEQIVLQLRGKGQNIDNVGEQQAKIKILAVHNSEGNNVLARQGCGQNAAMANESYFSHWGGPKTAYINNKSVQYNELEVRKKVKLKPGVDFSKITSLQGEIELALVTRTRTEQFAKAATEQHKTLTAYGSRLFFRPSADSSLSYTVSGDEQRILAVRAMNKDKQYLRRSSSSSMGSFWGAGRSVSRSYHGKVALVEVVYAEQMETMLFPFSINKFPPYYTDEKWVYKPEPAKITSRDAWNEQYSDVTALEMTQENRWLGEHQARWHDGPFNLALYGLKASRHWGTSGQIQIKTPVIDELRHNLSALEIYIRYPQVAENGDIGKSYYYQLKANGYYMNGEFIPDKTKPYMQGEFSFNLPTGGASRQKDTPINAINGDIIVHLPVSKHSSGFADMTIGAKWEDEGVIAKIIRLGHNVMEFEISGSRSRLLQIALFDAKNQRISTSDIRHGFGTGTKSQQERIVVNYHGIPVKGQMTVSEGQQTRRYPFELKLN